MVRLLRSRTLAIAAVAGLAATALPVHAQHTHHAPTAAHADAQREDALPIRGITLYRSGVGSFERSGTVSGDAAFQLRFDADQINDILKSMVVLDLDGGSVVSVGYGSKEPLARRLASFAVDISDAPSVPVLLGRLRGVPVEIDRGAAGSSVRGTVLSVETKTRVEPDSGLAMQYAVVSLLTTSGVRTVSEDQIEGFRILDEHLAGELRRALEALAEHRTDTIKSVDITLAGEGERRVVATYVHEMPVWKTSYRLVLRDNDGATIQGWAIVENTTDEDWTDVQLRLVAGRPVSFVMDLYEPLFLERPEIGVPVMAGVGPKVYEKGSGRSSGFAGRAGGSGGAPAPESSLIARRRSSEAAPAPSSAPTYDMYDDSDMMRAVSGSAASASEIGEVFSYLLDEPVTVERRRSAMLPILTGAVEARRVSIFDPGSGRNPMRGVWLENNAGLQLMPGPISVYDGTVYAGDAQIGHVSQGDTRLLAYAVDLDVTIDTQRRGGQTVRAVTIADGVIRERVEERYTTTYTIDNGDADDGRTVVVQHQRRRGFDLTSEPQPAERTDSHFRFEHDVEPGGESTLTVGERRVVSRSVSIAGYDVNRLAAYVRGGQASQAVLDAVEKAAELQRAVSQARRAHQQLVAERASIAADQDRIRENLSKLSPDMDYAKRLVRKLDEQETELERLDERAKEAQAAVEQAEAALRDYLHGLDVK